MDSPNIQVRFTDEELAQRLHDQEMDSYLASQMQAEADAKIAKQIASQRGDEDGVRSDSDNESDEEKGPKKSTTQEIEEEFDKFGQDIEKGLQNIGTSITSVWSKFTQKTTQVFGQVKTKVEESSQKITAQDTKKEIKNLFTDIKSTSQQLVRKYIKDNPHQVFGLTIREACKGQHSMPLVVEHAIDIIEARGLREPGIFKLSGTSQTQLTEIKNLYDSGAVVDLSMYDVNLVAELLLAYFQDLPEQIIPNDVDEIGRADYVARITKLRTLIQSIPRENKAVLKRLCGMWKKLLANSDENQLLVEDLVDAFGPGLVRHFGSAESHEVVKFIIGKSDELFSLVYDPRSQTLTSSDGTDVGSSNNNGSPQNGSYNQQQPNKRLIVEEEEDTEEVFEM
eukprot:TRINITY_DN2325_c0_g2_i1.p1 TRINITY_DN2325_c0_g2~~TRINITY_DN2325_c0_g2_i1.p1  ORF type:complete len:395 (-),score=122.52 TRINITY_DN2325_c0_g2_i1:90-1274(-)